MLLISSIFVGYRRQKQIIIGLISAIAGLGIMFGLVSLIEKNIPFVPSDLSEQDISEEPGLEDLETTFADFFEINKDTYDIVAYIRNPNTEYGASKVTYEFNFLDENDEVLLSVPGETFILPGVSRYVVRPALRISYAPRKIVFNVNEVKWQRLAPFSPAGLILKDTNFFADKESLRTRFSGVASNMSPYNLKNVEVNVVLYRGGKPVGAGRTDMQDLLRGADRFFQIAWPKIFDAATVDARIESNFLGNSNFIRDYGR